MYESQGWERSEEEKQDSRKAGKLEKIEWTHLFPFPTAIPTSVSKNIPLTHISDMASQPSLLTPPPIFSTPSFSYRTSNFSYIKFKKIHFSASPAARCSHVTNFYQWHVSTHMCSFQVASCFKNFFFIYKTYFTPIYTIWLRVSSEFAFTFQEKIRL